MTTLPAVVLIPIFQSLVQRDKLECMTVCKRWRDVIQHYCSFPVVYIDRMQQLKQVVEKFYWDSVLSAKVVQLTLDLMFLSDFDANIFTPFFPNIRYFALLTANMGRHGSGTTVTKYENHPWCKSIETIIENRSDFNTNVLLHSGLCNNLTYIVVNGLDKSAYHLINGLVNAPALKKLYLIQYNITFSGLELLHKNTPQLESLILETVHFDDGPIPDNIKPATSMKYFRCISYEFDEFDIFNPHLLYIREKYTKLIELGINLTQLNFDRSAVAPQRQIISSCFQKLSPHLKTLSLSLDGHDGDWMSGGFDFNILDECGCKIENLELGYEVQEGHLYTMSKLNQVNYIQSLTVHKVYFMDGSPMELDWLPRFTKLKELSLRIYEELEDPMEKKISLNNLLENLRNTRLEKLELYEADLILDGPNLDILYPWLKDITLSDTTIQAGVDAFISRSFPNLKRLKLENCLKSGDSFKLPNTNLCYLSIINRHVNGNFPVALTTLHDNQSRLYYSRAKDCFFQLDRHELQNDIFTSPAVSSVPLDEAYDSPMLSIVCRSVNNFLLKNIKI